jgi:peptidoglycan/LPS O-acetylase OafA/YrhL
MRHIPQIDALRAVAVIAVLIYHLQSEWLPGGFAGVDVFFVISGYVVSASLVSLPTDSLKRFVLHFYARRILRIIPALVVCLVVTSIVTLLFVPESWLSGSNYQTILLGFFGLSNFALVFLGDGYFSPRTEYNVATHTWSLAVEEQFYVIFPVIFYFYLKAKNSKNNFGTWVTLALFGASLMYSIYSSLYTPVSSYYLLPSRFWELGAGALLFQIHQRGWRLLPSRGHGLASVVGLGLLALSFAYANVGHFPFPWAIPAVLGTMIFIDEALTVTALDSLANRVLALSPLVSIGKVSYSLYLWLAGICVIQVDGRS